MSYKHPADEPDTILYWENEQQERFGLDFDPRRSRWPMCFSKSIDIPPSDLETVKSQYPECIFQVEKHSKNFDTTLGSWVECEPFLRVYIDADEVNILSEIDGQKVAPCAENSKLLEQIFWVTLKMTKQVQAMSNKEVRKNRRVHGLKS
jgi:hypothetical protein